MIGPTKPLAFTFLFDFKPSPHKEGGRSEYVMALPGPLRRGEVEKCFVYGGRSSVG